MSFMNCISEGFRIAGRHKRLVLVLWLAPLLPALALAVMIASNLAPCLGRSLFADRALEGDWLVVLLEFRASPADALGPILSIGVIVMAVLSFVLQVVLSAGIVEVVLERTERNPFVLGVRNNFLRFFRTSVMLTACTVVAVIAARLLMRGLFKIAEAQSDGRFDLFGVVAAAVLFFLLWAPLDLAADLSRIASARHDQRSMLRGFLRAIGSVFRRPGLFVPISLVFLGLPLAAHLVYYQIRSPWSAATLMTIVASLLLQQTVMLLRAFFKLGFWGTEVAAYRRLEEPELCRPRSKVVPVGQAVERVAEEHRVP